MEFQTSDYQWHYNAKMEWKYLWGRLSDKRFFHYVEFRKDGNWFRHYSLDGQFWEDNISNLSGFGFKTPYFDLDLCPETKPVVHDTTPFYYSISHLIGTSRYSDGVAEAWYDQYWDLNDCHVGSNWEWFGIKLNCGISVMAYDRSGEKLCDITYNDKTFRSDFFFDYPKHFYICELGSYLTFEPMQQEVIFKPKYGRPYSETPVEVIAKGECIGYGMRERTYKE